MLLLKRLFTKFQVILRGLQGDISDSKTKGSSIYQISMFAQAFIKTLTSYSFQVWSTHLCPFSKSKSAPICSIKSDRVNLVAPASQLLIVCFINPMFVRYSTNWDRKGWPGSEIKMYHGCLWESFIKSFFLKTL